MKRLTLVPALLVAGCVEAPLPSESEPVAPLMALTAQLTDCETSDLIQAIDAANATSGSTISLAKDCIYTLTEVNNVSTEFGINGLPIITSSTTIDGNGAAIERGSGAPQFRAFYVLNTADPDDAPVSVTLNDLTISGGDFSKSGAGVFNDRASVTLNRVTLSGNSASDDGGGLHNELGIVHVRNSTISGNHAGDWGGGISNNGGTVAVHGSTVSDNDAADSGGGLSNEGGTLSLDDHSIVSGNEAGDDGGGLKNSAGGTVAMHHSTLSGNSAPDDGGGLSNSGGTVTIQQSVVAGNRANDAGAGLHNDEAGTLIVVSSTIRGNEAGETGGGVFSYDAVAVVTRSTISANRAKWGGGVVNESAEAGGVLTILSSTISDNRAGEGAGGVFNDKGGNVTLTHSTVSGNEALTKGGGGVLSYNDADGHAEITGSIIAGNTPDDVAAVEDKTRFASLGHNLIGRPGAIVDFNQDFRATGDQRNITEPQLGALQNNGGATFTHALLSGSPALGTGGGDCPATDQRGVGRPQGGACDIGAFEASSPTIIFEQPPSPATYGGTFTVAPTATTGLPVSLAGTPGICSVAPAVAPATGFYVTMRAGTGTCTLTASQQGIAPLARAVAAQKAVLRVTANDPVSAFGEPTPFVDAVFSGFVSPDDAGSLGGTLAFTFEGTGSTIYGPEGTAPTAVGTYAIAPDGLSSDDYSFVYVAGALTITAAAEPAAIRFQAHANAHNGSAGTLRISRPAGVAPGDFLLAQILFEKGSDAGSNAQLTPAGWTLVRRTNRGTDLGQAIFYRVATDAEPSSYVWTFSQPVTATGGILRYTGVDADVDAENPIVVSSGNTGDSNTLTATGVAAEERSMLVAFYGLKKKSTSLSTPSGMTSRYYFESEKDAAVLGADELRAAAGATGNRTSTAASADKWVAHLVALRPIN